MHAAVLLPKEVTYTAIKSIINLSYDFCWNPGPKETSGSRARKTIGDS